MGLIRFRTSRSVVVVDPFNTLYWCTVTDCAQALIEGDGMYRRPRTCVASTFVYRESDIQGGPKK